MRTPSRPFVRLLALHVLALAAALACAIPLGAAPPAPLQLVQFIENVQTGAQYPFTTNGLQTAANDAQPDQTVQLCCGGQLDLNGEILINKRIHITGDGAISISANGLSRHFHVGPAGFLFLHNLNLANGNGDQPGQSDQFYGGSVLVEGKLDASGVTFSANHATSGGAIQVQPGGSIHGKQVFFNRNNGNNGGVINNAYGGMAVLNDFTFSNNSSTSGGAIFNAGDGYFGSEPGTESQTGGSAASPGPGWSAGIFPQDAEGANAPAAVVSPSIFLSNSATYGGAIWNTGSLTLTNVAILSNTASATGGGIQSFTGTLVIEGALVAHNRATTGGGGIESDWLMTATALSVISNTASAYNGGGLDLYNGRAVISGSTFMSNSAQSLGGAIQVNSGQLLLDSSTVARNHADNGGGMYQGSGASTSIVNSTFSGNSATYSGGIHNQGALTITSSTVVSNSAPGDIGNLDGSAGGAWLHNSIIAFGAPLNCTGLITSTGHNLENANSCKLKAAGDMTGTNPLLGPLQNNGGTLLVDGQAPWTHALLAGSPAVNHGDNSGCPPADERGAPRPFNITCDIGAYELGAKIGQSLTFTLPALIGRDLSPYPLDGSASSGLAVTYTVSGAPCSVAGSSLLLSGTGPCSVTAHQAGNANYSPARNVTQAITIGLRLFLPLFVR